MALLLNVPYVEKDQAKALGARWNPELKTWYVTNKSKYAQFEQWLGGSLIVYDHIYVVEGIHTCYRCEKETTVIGFGFETYYDFHEPNSDLDDGEIHIGPINSQLPKKLAIQLKERYGLRTGYSKTIGSSYCANHCRNCNAFFGNFYLFDEVETPFFIDGEEAASKLILRKINLPYDIAVTAEVSYGSEDYNIKKYARIVDSDLKWE